MLLMLRDTADALKLALARLMGVASAGVDPHIMARRVPACTAVEDLKMPSRIRSRLVRGLAPGPGPAERSAILSDRLTSGGPSPWASIGATGARSPPRSARDEAAGRRAPWLPLHRGCIAAAAFEARSGTERRRRLLTVRPTPTYRRSSTRFPGHITPTLNRPPANFPLHRMIAEINASSIEEYQRTSRSLCCPPRSTSRPG